MIIIFVVAVIWILITTLAGQMLGWSVEQAIFEGSLGIPDIRWLVALVYGLALFLPFLLLSLLVKDQRWRAIYRAWMLAALAALLLFTSRFFKITAAQTVAALQILILVLLLVGVRIWSGRRAENREMGASPAKRSALGLAWLLGAALAYPWVLWGALGSPVDVLLSLLVSLAFGALAATLLRDNLFFGQKSPTPTYKFRHFLFDGFIASITLLILAAGLGQNGNQWLLALGVVGLGWAAAAINLYGRDIEAGSAFAAITSFLGLGLFWPLAWIDADELALVVSGGEGELIVWALRAGLAGMGIALLAAFLLGALHKSIRRASGLPVAARAALLLAWLALGGVYWVWGQPGFHGERLFVILKDQADVSQASQIQDYNQRRAMVYETLTQHAGSTQAELRAAFERWGIRYQPYYLVNGLEVQAGPLVRLWLERRPEVDRVLDSPVLRPLPAEAPLARGNESVTGLPDWNLTMIEADRVWEMGITGAGIVIGQSDSGVEGSHPELAAAYRGKDSGDDFNWFDPWYRTRRPGDIGGHGTHTLGSILGKRVGVAPGAAWIGCVNLARNLANTPLYLDCMQFMLAPFPQEGDPLRDGEPGRGAHVLNNSWGCPDVEGCDPEALLPAVRALHAAGVFVVASAGNSGYAGCGSVEDPIAIYEEVFSVGAIDASGQLAAFSSLGPVMVDGSLRTKPDLVAPGVRVLSAYPGGTYHSGSGTSMAGPHVTGVVALMWSANPGLVGDIERTRQILIQTASPYTGTAPGCVSLAEVPNDGAGYGLVNAYEAVRAALELHR